MIQVNIADYIVQVGESMPERDDPDCARAALVERFGSEWESEQRYHGFHGWHDLHVEVRWASPWPFLCVGQQYERKGGGYPGVLLVPETAVLFIGAGERLLAYDLRGPTRLWEDQADAGFHGWQRHEDLVVMSAELELAAWDLGGVKRWSAFVEPPWGYHVESGTVHLDVMGTVSSFPLWVGPSHA